MKRFGGHVRKASRGGDEPVPGRRPSCAVALIVFAALAAVAALVFFTAFALIFL